MNNPSDSPPAFGLSPVLLDELVLDILVRAFPPDRPEFLVRAFLVSKAWRRAISDPDFCRLYRDFHRTPPLLGFFFRGNIDRGSSDRDFVPTTAFRASTATPTCHMQRVLNACHGRVLFTYVFLKYGFTVWDPMTGDERYVPPVPSSLLGEDGAYAVLCATVGCNHRACHGGPFLVAFVYKTFTKLMSACVYSSENGTWSDTTSIKHPEADKMTSGRLCRVLVENTLCMRWETIITGYNLDDRQLKVIDMPSALCHHWSDDLTSTLMTAEDGTLGFAALQESNLHLWSRKAGHDGAMVWEQYRVIDLEMMLPICCLGWLSTHTYVSAFADGVPVIFISTRVGLFTIELSSDRVRMVCGRVDTSFVVPYTSFYTPDLATRRLPPP